MTRSCRLLPALALAFAACLSSPETDTAAPDRTVRGGGSDSETLTGMVATAAGAPAARALVKLFPADYDPSRPDGAQVRSMLTSDSGRFRFEKLDTARTYNLIAGNAGEKSWAYAAALKPGPASKLLALSLAKVFLFSVHADAYSPKDSGIAYFPGTDILTHCNGMTASQVDSVPSGLLRFIVESRAGWRKDTTLTAARDTTKVSASKNSLRLLP
jgi:hypothetical protein